MKLWLLDADVIIDLLSLNSLDSLVKNHKVFAASTVIEEVKFFKRNHEKVSIDFRKHYVANGLLNELSASIDEIAGILDQIPDNARDTIDAGELESLAILIKEESLIFCSCDSAVIRILPILNISERGISVEKLLKSSGLQSSDLKERHTEHYFQNNLAIGKKNKIYSFDPKKEK